MARAPPACSVPLIVCSPKGSRAAAEAEEANAAAEWEAVNRSDRAEQQAYSNGLEQKSHAATPSRSQPVDIPGSHIPR
jgi:hypothetical protein